MRLAVLDDYENAALKSGNWERLGSEIKIDVYNDHLVEEDMLVNRLLPHDILIIMRERTPFTRSLIERLPNLKLLVTTGPGNRAIDLAACKKKGVVVCGTDRSGKAPAESCFQLFIRR